MLQATLIRDEHIEPLGEAVATVLEEVGIFCQHQEILATIEAAGAQVDPATERVHFPREMTRRFVAAWRAEAASLPERTESYAPPGLEMVTGQVAQYYYDYARREKRSGNSQDFVTMLKLGEVLHGEAGVGHSLLCADVPPLLEPLHAVCLMAEHVTHPHSAYMWNARQKPYLEEMAAILGLKRLHSWGAMCFAHPLRFDRNVAERFLEAVRGDGMCGMTAMPVVGVTTPVTIEGFIAVSAAEHVATWMLGRSLNPHCHLAGSQWVATIDMRSGSTSYSAPEAMYHAFASIEFLRRWTGVDIPPGSGEYCDARHIGMYAVLEKHFKAMMVTAFTGRSPGVGQGMVECGKTISPVQLLLERDYTAGYRPFGWTLDPSPENIALPTIREVGLGFEHNFLESEHTLRNFRQRVWLPEIWDRSGWAGFDHETAVLDAAQAKFEGLLEQYRKPEGREEQLSALRKVVEKAARELR
jgi:trimethylamine---corrinoid protein Co-methyltransferase